MEAQVSVNSFLHFAAMKQMSLGCTEYIVTLLSGAVTGVTVHSSDQVLMKLSFYAWWKMMWKI